MSIWLVITFMYSYCCAMLHHLLDITTAIVFNFVLIGQFFIITVGLMVFLQLIYKEFR